VRGVLSAVLEQNAVAIPLEVKRFGIRVGVVADKTRYDSAVFVLAARADLPTEEFRRSFVPQVKVGPVERIANLVNLGLPGIGMRAMPAPPRQIPYHSGFQYFELEQGGIQHVIHAVVDAISHSLSSRSRHRGLFSLPRRSSNDLLRRQRRADLGYAAADGGHWSGAANHRMPKTSSTATTIRPKKPPR
jgi:hypothetical protein